MRTLAVILTLASCTHRYGYEPDAGAGECLPADLRECSGDRQRVCESSCECGDEGPAGDMTVIPCQCSVHCFCVNAGGG